MNQTLPPICGDGFLATLSRPRVAASFWHPPQPQKFAQMCRDGLQIAEIRLDLAQSQTEESARTLLSAVSALPSILTIRPPFEGGKFAADENKRRNLFYRLLPFASAADIELSAEIRPDIVAAAKKSGAATIISQHNFNGVESPAAINTAANQAFAEGADVFKYAAAIKNQNEFAALKSFLQQWTQKPENPPVIVIGMGTAEIAQKTRRDFPALGSRITFAAANEIPTAPGQLTIKDAAAAAARYSP